MIKITSIKGHFSPLDGDLDLGKLLQEHQDDVVLSCDEPRYKMGGYLEQATARYLSTLLPIEYTAKWDESTEGYQMQQSHARELPAKINELRFKVLLQETQ